MAAYAALVSLMDLIEQIQHHPNPPLTLDPKQAQSLTEKISFLQRFLEDFHSHGFSQEIQALESRITDVAHAAEDVIESQILLVSGVRNWRWTPSWIWNLSTGFSKGLLRVIKNTKFIVDYVIAGNKTDFYEGLQRVIQDMELVEKEVMDTKKKKPRVEDDDDDDKLRRRRSMLPPSLGLENTTTMMGFDHICIKIMERLTQNQSRKLDIIPLVGMGGAGKTTLARNIYENKLIVEHFEVRAWATISQQCVVREVLIDFLLCLSNNQKSREGLSQYSEEDLGKQLYQSLFGRRYSIVMDDVWNLDAWNNLKFFFPDKDNGSRILITTRLSNLAFELTGSHSHVVKVDLLDEDASWDLLSKKVFADKICPSELEEIGRMIARNCRGLPLSIVTIGGHLAKSGMTRDYWEHVAKNLSSLVNSEDEERCLRILSLSYIHLPVHLKPCFLYMGLFPEDERIKASHLIGLWVAEGFLKPIGGKFLEEVGEDYMKDLVERNLVSVDQWGVTGKIRFCILHDLLRDLCLREARKEKFFSVEKIVELQGKEISNTERRVAIHESMLKGEYLPPYHGASYSAPLLRSCIFGAKGVSRLISLRSSWFLRVLGGVQRYVYCDVNIPLVNSRFINLHAWIELTSPLWSMSWNLQTLVMFAKIAATLDIWKMPQLRHVRITDLDLLDPPPPSCEDGGRLIVLENLQTLSTIRDFKCSEEVVKRIPNVKKLKILYRRDEGSSCIHNLGSLKILESLTIGFYADNSCLKWWDGLRLPYSLKRLTLYHIYLDNDVMSTKIGGSLPHLEVLKLQVVTFNGDEWNPVEGQFCRLRYLQLYEIKNLKYWNAETTHFPCLEHLRIEWAYYLKDFPWSIGDIPTLRSIELRYVKNSVLISAKQMLEEQEQEYGNVTLLIRTIVYQDQKELAESLASNNFKIIE